MNNKQKNILDNIVIVLSLSFGSWLLFFGSWLLHDRKVSEWQDTCEVVGTNRVVGEKIVAGEEITVFFSCNLGPVLGNRSFTQYFLHDDLLDIQTGSRFNCSFEAWAMGISDAESRTITRYSDVKFKGCSKED